MTERVSLPYGSWPSPITAVEVARGSTRLGFPSVIGEQIWWEESRPDEGGRTTVMHRAADGTVSDLLPLPWSAATRVHETGGRSHLPVPRRDDKAITRYGIVFAEAGDQRLYLLEKGAREPVALTPEPAVPGAVRYADPALSPDGKRVICVRETHSDSTVARAIVSVPLSGRAVSDPTAVRELVSGADFFASPTPSPDGERLAWISWNHPRMPWDGTELRVGAFTPEGAVSAPRTIRGGTTESVLSPRWRDANTLLFLSDWTGWWNLYEVKAHGQAMAQYPEEAEFTLPPWQLGAAPFGILDDGRVVTLYGHADLNAGIYDPETAQLTPLKSSLTTWRALATDGKSVVGVAASPTEPDALVQVNPETGVVRTLRSAVESPPPASYLPVPRSEEISGRYGARIHAFAYPPTSPEACADGPAPYVVWVHGGPTGCADSSLDLAKAYFTSRGIGILDVNHGGSTGYGRSYRERLHRNWGVVDVEDATAAVLDLVERGIADPTRLAVRGASAGGLTTLLALTGTTFACGTSYYGVTDLMRLAAETHDFESRYLDTIIGPLPGYASVYEERSPVNRVHEIDVPVLLLQGDQDPIVPPAQAGALASALTARGVVHAHIEFAGEPHGFRKAESVRAALEAELAFYCKVFFGFTPPGVPPIALTGG
ncbi:S9 family peptidase [Nocardiopsis ansamitocini]|uniref:Acyl-peptide hydrolase n=1 Tax=Nocardiopsis ansamitocini TaxID=1670832 RepID=A0A9W6P3C5_9ACTN|nr:prolyl oligopeptidase family serine peptidase [Nocardiopsis ansamitocini]GLU46406.1 acyl-peptide hydrolase [Nocardiopsis ansamitocini]